MPGRTCALREPLGCARTSYARTRSSRSPRGPWTPRRGFRSSRGRVALFSCASPPLFDGPLANPGESRFESVLEQKELEVSPGAIQIRGGREGVRANGTGRHVEDVTGGGGDGLAKLGREVGRRGFGVRVDERGGVLEPAVYRSSGGEHPARRQGGEVVGRTARALRGEDAQGSLHRRVGDTSPGDGRPDRVAAEVRLAHKLPRLAEHRENRSSFEDYAVALRRAHPRGLEPPVVDLYALGEVNVREQRGIRRLPRRRADGHERAVEARRAAAERLNALERVAAPGRDAREFPGAQRFGSQHRDALDPVEVAVEDPADRTVGPRDGAQHPPLLGEGCAALVPSVGFRYGHGEYSCRCKLFERVLGKARACVPFGGAMADSGEHGL